MFRKATPTPVGICGGCDRPCDSIAGICPECEQDLAEMDAAIEADKLHQHERQMDIECYHNIYKSIHGHRPRHIDFDSMTDDELQAAIKAL